MSNKQKTAVEWLEEHINIGLTYEQQIIFEGLFKKAKEIEKHQIEYAYKADLYPCSDEDAEQYYKETYEQ